MSFVTTQPEALSAAAGDLQGIGADLTAHNAAVQDSGFREQEDTSRNLAATFDPFAHGLHPELEVAAELEYQARRFGAKALSFPAIVAVGSRAALPHARPTSRTIGESDFTLIDWGVNSGLYMSDLTRIIVTGKISPKLRKIYGVVLKAQLAAIDAIRPDRTCEEIDRVARDIITRAGFGKAFIL